MRIVTRLAWISTVLALISVFLPLTAVARGGNSAAAHACQRNGYTQWTTSDGIPFKNAGQCTSYAARGGVLTAVATGTVEVELLVEWDLFGPGTVFIEGEQLAPGSVVQATVSGRGVINLTAPVAVVGSDGTFFVATSYSGCVRVEFSGTTASGQAFTTRAYAAPPCGL
jgi:hypothetical protein